MLKKTGYLLILVLLLTSCATTYNTWNADTNMRKVKVGMSQKEVMAVMGKTYDVVGANRETIMWGYKTHEDAVYVLQFQNEKLVQWEKTWPKREHIHTNHHHHTPKE